MNKEAKAEEELMLSVVRGIIDKHGPNGLYEDFNAFERRVEEMQKTLEWYADPENYVSRYIDDTVPPYWEAINVEQEGGERARQTLQSVKGAQHE